ncbi:MAG: TIGR04100 family radical SAM protein [Oscillospiraceae bacterium]|jgi:radical SAM enzyme (TIGR04100 family)
MKMTILYEIGNKLYLNLTNKCPCDCIFCIRNNGDGAYGSDSLWLENDPTAEQVISELKMKDLNSYEEIVFCGFGEPFEALEILLEAARFLKTVTAMPLRINTNGLSDMIHQRPTAQLLEGIIDVVSVSLNAGSEEEYLRVTRPSFGKKAFEAMIKFAVDCKKYVGKVVFSVVDILPEKELELCRKISDETGIPLRIRKYDE